MWGGELRDNTTNGCGAEQSTFTLNCLFLLSRPKNVTLLESFCLEFHPVPGFMHNILHVSK